MMMTGRVEGFFGLSASGAQYRYAVEYATALGHVIWSAQVFADDLLKGRPSGVVHGSIEDIERLEHHIRDCVTSSITNHINVEP
jgi:hypothetical protein